MGAGIATVLASPIMAVIARHVQVGQDDVQIAMDRGDTMSTLEIDVNIPNRGGLIAA